MQTYAQKFIRDGVVAPFVLLSVVIVTLSPFIRVATGPPNGKQLIAKVTGACGVTRFRGGKVPFKPRVEKWTELRGQGNKHTVVFPSQQRHLLNGLMLAQCQTPSKRQTNERNGPLTRLCPSVRSFVRLSLCLSCLSGASILWGGTNRDS